MSRAPTTGPTTWRSAPGQIALEAVGHARVCDADFYYQLVKWVSRLEAEASVDHAGMERANAHEQRALSHLWQVRGEAQDAGAGV